MASALRGVAVGFSAHGSPEKVLRVVATVSRPLASTDVLLRVEAAPINPSDINAIQGVYPVLPAFEHGPERYAVAGNEGMLVVVDKGCDVNYLAVGDKVLPALSASGTWQSMLICDQNSLLKIPASTDMLTAATLAVNPCTAYRMIRDYVDWTPDSGATLIQNAGNSAVGQSVIQMAKAWGIRTINVIRDRPDFTQVKDRLLALGATHVIKELDIRREVPAILKAESSEIKLALNGVSGKSATDLARFLRPGGVMVTYGGHVKFSTSISLTFWDTTIHLHLLQLDIVCRGFWMAEWNKRHSRLEREKMLETIIQLANDGHYHPSLANLVEIDVHEDPKIIHQRVLTAVQQAGHEFSGEKQVFIFKH